MRQVAARDGVGLAVREWPCAGSRATVLVVHGLGEHGGRYAEVAAHLVERGFRVVAYDHRGHGNSGGLRGRLTREDDLLVDLARVIDAERAAHPAPLVLLGHSLGGLVAARFVGEALNASPQAWSREVDALALSSPALDAGLSRVQRALLAVLEPIAPNLAVGNGIKPEWLSRDSAVVAAYRADPLVHDRIAPRLARFIADQGAEVLAAASRWRVPTLAMWAGADRCVAPRGSAAFVASAPKSLVTARAFPALFHEIFNEPERGEVLSVLDRWLDTLPFCAREGATPP